MNFFRALCLAAVLGPAVLSAAEPTLDSILQEIDRRFTPAKPTVVMTYDVRYRFLALNLMQVARATLEATEGAWDSGTDGNGTACCVIRVRLQSDPGSQGGQRDGRIFLDDQIVSVVTMPGLETLYYLKRTDERLRPLFGSKKNVLNFHVYDLTGGGLQFFAHDELAGTTTTNLTGATDMASQGREVSRVLSLLSDVYHGRKGPIGTDSDFRIFVNCDGKAVPFAARSARETVTAAGDRYDALRVQVIPAREAPRGVRARDFTVWATAFAEVAGRTEDADLQRVAAETPAWGMTPLLSDYGLALGSIRCSLVSIQSRVNPPPSNSGETVADARPEPPVIR